MILRGSEMYTGKGIDVCISIENNLLYVLEHNKTLHDIFKSGNSDNYLKLETSYEFKYEKLSKETRNPTKKTHKLILTGSDNNIEIYVKLNQVNLLFLKLQRKEFLLQKETLKIGVIVGIGVSVLLSLGTYFILPLIKQMKVEPDNPPKTEIKKSLEIKKDTIAFMHDNIDE